MDTKLTWYIARASGLTTWLLCAAAIVWGLVLSTKLIRRRGLPAWLLDLHTFLGTLSVVFCAIHLGALALDGYTHWGWAELFVPMASAWKPGPTAWGIAAFYLLMAVQVTSWFRRRLPKRIWHTIHLGSFALFAAGTAHGVTAGTDWTNRAVQWGSVGVGLFVVALMTPRFARRGRRTQRVPTAARAAQLRSPP